jgi:hypothetical protein
MSAPEAEEAVDVGAIDVGAPVMSTSESGEAVDVAALRGYLHEHN